MSLVVSPVVHEFGTPDGPEVVEVLVADVIALLESVCRGPAVLLGHSLGGRLGLLVASRRPDLVDRLVLEDPALVSAAAATDPFLIQTASGHSPDPTHLAGGQ